MAQDSFKVKKSLNIEPIAGAAPTAEGDIAYDLTAHKASIHNGTTASPVVTEAHSATLTNKTLSGNTATNLVSGSGTLTLNTSGTITVPNGTDTLVGKNTSDVLTNKTLTGNIAVNLVSGAATVTLPTSTSTLATLALSETLTNKTLTTPIISTISNTGTLTLPTSTDTLVGRATTDTLTNKTLTAPVIDVATLDGQASAPANPSAGNYKLYVSDTTTKLSLLDSAGVVTTVGAGSGGVNYITHTDGTSIGDWVTFADGATATPVDGTGGSPGVTFAVSTNSDLRGTSNFLFTKDAADRQGEGFSYNFTIDPSDKGKVLQCSLEYQVASGTFADDGLTFWIYDITNAALIQPAPYKLKNSGIVEKFAFEFQTASNSTSYRLIAIVTTTTATAYTLRFDNWNLGPQAKLYGSAVTDWVSFTPTGSWSTYTTYTGFKRRVGDIQEYDIKVAVAGAPTSAALTVNLGATIDTAKLAGTDANVALGHATIYDATGIISHGVVAYNANDSVKVLALNAAGTYVDAATVTQAVPFTFASGDYVRLKFSVPIVGASSSQIMSSDASTRIIAVQATNSAGTSVATATEVDVIYGTVAQNWGGAYNSTTGVFTAPTPGFYFIDASASILSPVGFNGLDEQWQLYLTDSANTAITGSINSVNPGGASVLVSNRTSKVLYMLAGETVKVRTYQDSDSTNTLSTTASHANSLNIFLLQSSAQIAASESVSARYKTATAQSIPHASATIINYDTVSESGADSHGSVTTGASWKFTPSTSGRYSVNAAMVFNTTTTWEAGEQAYLMLYKNNVLYSLLSYKDNMLTAATYVDLRGADDIRLLASDYIDIRVYQSSGAALTLFNDAAYNYVSITRTGNY